MQFVLAALRSVTCFRQSKPCDTVCGQAIYYAPLREWIVKVFDTMEIPFVFPKIEMKRKKQFDEFKEKVIKQLRV